MKEKLNGKQLKLAFKVTSRNNYTY